MPRGFRSNKIFLLQAKILSGETQGNEIWRSNKFRRGRMNNE